MIALNYDLTVSLAEKELDELCFLFGLELDGVEKEGDEIIYKIEIPANRYEE